MAPRKVGQHHGDLRRAVMDAALELLVTGEAPLSLREVARRAGVTAAALYHHFANRAALMAAVGAEGFRNLDRALGEVRSRRAAGEARLAELVATYVRFAVAHRAHYLVMFDPQIDGDAHPELETAARASFRRLVEEVALTRPDLDADAHLARARMAWAATHGAVLLRIDGSLEKLGAPRSLDLAAQEVARAVVAIVTSPAEERT